ncbi:hypothetical protein P8452_30448 [Trifolium repens]|nr:hypothetical protein P8452_30448 [Trifolium repens]
MKNQGNSKEKASDSNVRDCYIVRVFAPFPNFQLPSLHNKLSLTFIHVFLHSLLQLYEQQSQHHTKQQTLR